MIAPKRRLPIPIVWIYLFLGASCAMLSLLALALQSTTRLRDPFLAVLFLSPVALPALFLGFHRLCSLAESRGWIYYRRPRSGGLGPGILLDLDLLLSRPKGQVETLRHAREQLREGLQNDAEGTAPPGEAGS